MNTFVKTARRIALAVTLVSAFAASGIVARAEGGGVGSGGYPPPKLIVVTPDYAVYDDGTIIYANGTRGHI